MNTRREGQFLPIMFIVRIIGPRALTPVQNGSTMVLGGKYGERIGLLEILEGGQLAKSSL